MILPNRRLSLCLAFIMGIVVSSSSAFALGDGIEGRKVAVRWCAACHLVTADQTKGSADAPPFTEIRDKHHGNMEFLEGFLTQTHPQMPDMNLSTLEIRNLIAFIKDL